MLGNWKRLLSPTHDQSSHRRRTQSLRDLCGNLVTKSLDIPNCTYADDGEEYPEGGDAGKYCFRDYDLYIPSIVCKREYHRETNILPLVFAVHCYGCHPEVMHYVTEYAESHNFILAIPHGIQGSFNAQQCCGTALAENVDDMGFFHSLVADLSNRLPTSISPELVYGFGWSNGGYMVVNAAHLFRAIAPVSGYQVYDDPAQGLSELVEQIAHRPIGLFLHHSQDDQNVAITGCCTDTTMPECCCGLSRFVDQCQSATDFVDIFAKTLNHCGGDPVESLVQVYPIERARVTCYQAGQNCWANTTYCIHDRRGHFNKPSLASAFPMTDDVTDFFARDACETVGGGSWSSEEKVCSCESTEGNFTYCLDSGWQERFQEPDWTTYEISDGGGFKSFGAIGMAVVILMAIIAMFVMAKEERKYRQFKAVSTFELSEFSVDPKLDEMEEIYKPKPIFSRGNLSKHI